jgi:phenylpyruvate tautomerase PptA (4-oxalocrotonate tautomerase family)
LKNIRIVMRLGEDIMPTCVCQIPPDTLNDSQKSAIAESIDARHSEATGAPRFFCQVVIEETRALRYLGGQKSSHHIWLRADIRGGRPEDVRSQMMVKMMQDISKITGFTEDDIWVYVCNLVPTDMVEYGHVLPKPGQEKQWFESLPPSLQGYLTRLGTSAETFTL